MQLKITLDLIGFIGLVLHGITFTLKDFLNLQIFVKVNPIPSSIWQPSDSKGFNFEQFTHFGEKFTFMQSFRLSENLPTLILGT